MNIAIAIKGSRVSIKTFCNFCCEGSFPWKNIEYSEISIDLDCGLPDPGMPETAIRSR